MDKIWNEKTHAFIAGKYYYYLAKKFDKRGVNAFIHATIYYAGQRGRRMAQRAIRDGKELTFETYSQYGEWAATEEMISQGLVNEREILEKSPEYKMNIRNCPWRAQFVEMGLPEAGIVYCTHLDNSISRGFNPYIKYDVNLDGLDGELDEFCTHTIGADIEGLDLKKKEGNVIGFEYHCAHSYWSFREVVIAIFQKEGYNISNLVLDDFSKEYGKEAADKLLSYEYTNFNVTY